MRHLQFWDSSGSRKGGPSKVLGTQGMCGTLQGFGDSPKLPPDRAKEGIGISRNSNTSEKSKPQKSPRPHCASSNFLLLERRSRSRHLKSSQKTQIFLPNSLTASHHCVFLSPLAALKDALFSLYLSHFGVFCNS